MSWLDRVNNQLEITTGDGETYKPNWMNANLSTEYNVSQFEFPEVGGTLVQRRKPKGKKYSLEIVFQGEDHLDVSEAFRISADDPRPWVIAHPVYGSITVQPLGLSFDNSKFNVTEIKGTVVETITDDQPRITVDPADKIQEDKDATDVAFAEAWVHEVPEPPSGVIADLTTKAQDIFNISSGKILNSEDAEGYFNAYNAANTAILNLTSDPLAAIRTVQAFLAYPTQFVDVVKSRVNLLVDQFNKLNDTITPDSPELKKNYELNAAGTISSMCLASVTDAEYDSRNDVLDILDLILESYNAFVVSLDDLQTDTGGEPESYMPDAVSLIALNALINFTAANLLDIALNSKQERSILLEDDTNLVSLAHRLYGLMEDDSTIQKLINNNQIQLNEMLVLPKGKKILYYV